MAEREDVIGVLYSLKEEYEFGLENSINKNYTNISENERLALQNQRLTYRACLEQLKWAINRIECIL